jgi:hypothetical protein
VKHHIVLMLITEILAALAVICGIAYGLVVLLL